MSCDLCKPDTYSLGINQKECKKCPENVECEGGNILSLHKGFWRESIETDNIYTCPN